MALTAYTLVTFYARQVTTQAFSTPVDVIQTGHMQSYTSGTGNYQVSKIFACTGTVNKGARVTLNIKNGSLKDGLGNSLAFSKLKFVYFHNSTTGAGAFVLTTIAGSSYGSFLFPWVSAASVGVQPQGDLVFSAPRDGVSLGGLGTWVHLWAASTTLPYKLVIVGY